MKTVIATAAAPAAIGPYSQAIQVGNMLFTSGQIPIDPATSQFVEGGIKEQTTQVFANLKAVLAEAGYTFDDVVKTTVFLAEYVSVRSDERGICIAIQRIFSGTVGCCRKRVAQRCIGGNRGNRREVKTARLFFYL